MGWWYRKKHGTQFGNIVWNNTMPKIDEMGGMEWDVHCELVWDAINDQIVCVNSVSRIEIE